MFTDHDFDLTIINHVEPRDAATLFGNPDYYIGYDNPTVRDLFTKADSELTDEAANADYQQALDQIATDAPVVWLWSFPNLIVADADVQGIVAEPDQRGLRARHDRRRLTAHAEPFAALGGPRGLVAAPPGADLRWSAPSSRRCSCSGCSTTAASRRGTRWASAAPPRRSQALCRQMGLDRPLLVQYLDWLGGAVRGDFGVSYVSKVADRPDAVRPARGDVVAGGRQHGRRAADRGAVGHARRAAQRPADWATCCPALADRGGGAGVPRRDPAGAGVRGAGCGWLPANGYVVPAADPVEFLRHMVLPWVSLGVVQGAVLARYVRSAVLDELGQDYLRTARSKGLTPFRALTRHGLRNASIPVLTVIGVNLVTVLVGAVIIERIFTMPGIGKGLADAAERRDLLTVQAIVVTLVLIALLISFLVDVAYSADRPAAADPGGGVTDLAADRSPRPAAAPRRAADRRRGGAGRGRSPSPRSCRSSGRRSTCWTWTTGTAAPGPGSTGTGWAPTCVAATSPPA